MGLFSRASKKTLDWEIIEKKVLIRTERLQVPGGWLVRTYVSDSSGITFYPDPDHSWQV